MNSTHLKKALFLVLALFSAPALSQKVDAALHCKPTPTDFIYDCVIALSKAGRPLTGAEITVGADMPSMPKMHAVKPVKAKPGANPGEYKVSLDLEMQGEWAVDLRLAGPVRNRLVLLYHFDDKGARAVKRSGRPPRK